MMTRAKPNKNLKIQKIKTRKSHKTKRKTDRTDGYEEFGKNKIKVRKRTESEREQIDAASCLSITFPLSNCSSNSNLTSTSERVRDEKKSNQISYIKVENLLSLNLDLENRLRSQQPSGRLLDYLGFTSAKEAFDDYYKQSA